MSLELTRRLASRPSPILLSRPSWPKDTQASLHDAIAAPSVSDIEQPGRGPLPGIFTDDADAQLAFCLATEEAQTWEVLQSDRELAQRLQSDDRSSDVAPLATLAQPTTITGPSNECPVASPEEAADAARTSTTSDRTLGADTANSPGSLTGHGCASCMDPIRGVEVRTPCGHYYDRTCVLALFETAMQDEYLFPPRCCARKIPVSSVSRYMSATFTQSFKEKKKEYGTRNRVHCARPSCSRFLGTHNKGSFPFVFRRRKLVCPAPDCRTVTCSACKNEVVSGTKHRCQPADVDVSVLSLGQQSGWARCPCCETMIELNDGCYHITCRCGAEFCYRCQARWRICIC